MPNVDGDPCSGRGATHFLQACECQQARIARLEAVYQAAVAWEGIYDQEADYMGARQRLELSEAVRAAQAAEKGEKDADKSRNSIGVVGRKSKA